MSSWQADKAVRCQLILCRIHIQKSSFFCQPRFDFFENVCSAGSVIETIGKGATQLNSFIIGSLYRTPLVQVTGKWDRFLRSSAQLSQSGGSSGAPCLHLLRSVCVINLTNCLWEANASIIICTPCIDENMWDERLGSTPGFSRSPVGRTRPACSVFGASTSISHCSDSWSLV